MLDKGALEFCIDHVGVLTQQGMADRLNDMGYRKFHGGMIDQTTVSRMLRRSGVHIKKGGRTDEIKIQRQG